MGTAKVTISARPSRASQLRVLLAVAHAAMTSKALRIPEGGRRLPLSVLVMAALAEEEHRSVNVDAVRKALHLTQASASRQIASHVLSGALERRSDKDDARKTILCLTKRGNAFIDEVLDAMRKAVIREREQQAKDET